MNFAWANPLTGAREQTLKAKNENDPEELKALESQARHAVWTGLQKTNVAFAFFWRQIEAGKISFDGSEIIISSIPGTIFAWCDPKTGSRERSKTWPEFDPSIFGREFSFIVIYAEVERFIVQRSDPEPEINLLPRTIPERVGSAPGESPIADWKARVEGYSALDSELLPQATAWALLDIAESLRRAAGFLSPQNVIPPLPEGVDEKLSDLCTCTGDGIRPEGGFCSCERGRELMRENAVRERRE